MSILEEIRSKYKEYLDLNYTQSLKDTEEKPFESKYKARQVLSDLKSTLDQNLEPKSDTSESYYKKLDEKIRKLQSKSAKTYLIEKLIDFNLAKNYIETEEFESGERLLSKTYKELEQLLIKDDDHTYEISIYNPLLYNLTVNCLNELVYVWSYRGVYENCIKLLDKSQEIYEFYKKTYTNDELLAPITINELILLDDDSQIDNSKREILFESIYTHSLFYMAQIYGKLDDKDKSALYCQLTLQRQIDYKNTCDDFVDNLNDLNKITFDSIDWATHAAALSQYYVYCDDFSTSRHCLCCAEAILTRLNEERKQNGSPNEEYSTKLDEQTASIKRCWGKYAIELLKTSIQYIKNGKKEPLETDKPSKFHFNLKNYDLHVFETNAMSPNYALTFNDAKKIFIKAQQILNEVANFYVFDGYVTDHCEIKRDLCELYKLIMWYDPNIENQSKYLKRRLDLLTPLERELNEQYYLYVKRQMLFDIASTYSDMMDNKADLLQKKRENPKEYMKDKSIDMMVNKQNQMCAHAIDYFMKFLDTMKVLPNKEKLPDTYDSNNVRPALLAHFYIGRLYSKLIPYQAGERLLNMKKTYEFYKYLVDYCDKHRDDKIDDSADVMAVMKVEYDICKEMVAFLPANMENIAKSFANK